MGYVAVDSLKQGMILDEEVRDINTRLLLSKGQKLADKHIRVLKIWGVVGVSVVGGKEDKVAEERVFNDEMAQEIQKRLILIFRNVDLSNPILKEIYRISLIHRLKGTFAKTLTYSGRGFNDAQMVVDSDQIKKKIQNIDVKLPEAPVIISELNQVIADPLATSNDVAGVVNKSPSLTSILLRIVNSAYFGFPSKIDKISRAVTIIGTKEVSGLALGISVMQAFKDIPKEIIDMQAFIRHSFACGMIARILAAINNIAQTEQLFVSGLLHDIGKLIVYKYYPDCALACTNFATTSEKSVFSTEKAFLGMNHTQIGKYLLVKWKLPFGLKNNIVHHHDPSRAPDAKKAGIVHLADMITHGLGIGASGERSIPSIDSKILDEIVLSPDTIKSVVRQAVHQLVPMDTIFSSEPI